MMEWMVALQGTELKPGEAGVNHRKGTGTCDRSNHRQREFESKTKWVSVNCAAL